MKIDRRFTKLKKRSLLSFSIRILRNATFHPELNYPVDAVDDLKKNTVTLENLMQALIIPRPKNLKEQIKEAEKGTVKNLIAMADFIELQELLKYDLYLSGFPLFTSKRKVA
jgi:hypothetical protein